MRLPHGIYAIVDGSASLPPLELVSAFVRGGAAVVQLRLKALPAGELLRLARAAREICEGRATLLVNDRPDVAKLAGVGVHLGQEDLPLADARALLGPDALIGISTHSDAEIDGAQEGADYIGFGPIFATRSKPGAVLPPPHGTPGLRRAVQRSRIPVVAIGGITAATAHEIASAGARCAAVIAEVCHAPDPEAAVRALVAAFADSRAVGASSFRAAIPPDPTGDAREWGQGRAELDGSIK